MKKQLAFIAILFAVCGSVSAQTISKTVEKIQARYEDIAEKARLCESDEDRGRYGDLVMNTLTVNSRSHEWRAVGIYGETYKFFYRGGDTEKHLYPDQLVLVKVERKVSDRQFYEEFFYSDAGQLVMYLSKPNFSDAGIKELRVYFSGKKPIRITEDGNSRDRLSRADIFSINERVGAAARAKQVFKLSIGL